MYLVLHLLAFRVPVTPGKRRKYLDSQHLYYLSSSLDAHVLIENVSQPPSPRPSCPDFGFRACFARSVGSVSRLRIPYI